MDFKGYPICIIISTFSAKLSLIFQDRPERNTNGIVELSSSSGERSRSRPVPDPRVAQLTYDELDSSDDRVYSNSVVCLLVTIKCT